VSRNLRTRFSTDVLKMFSFPGAIIIALAFAKKLEEFQAIGDDVAHRCNNA